jgi:hypothetical protein
MKQGDNLRQSRIMKTLLVYMKTLAVRLDLPPDFFYLLLTPSDIHFSSRNRGRLHFVGATLTDSFTSRNTRKGDI